jgi:hypothetical protein
LPAARGRQRENGHTRATGLQDAERKGSESDEELRVQKEERWRRLEVSLRDGGECGLNARRDRRGSARRLDHGYRRPRLWQEHGASRRHRLQIEVAGSDRRFAARHLRLHRPLAGEWAAARIETRRENSRGDHDGRRQSEERRPKAA